MNNLSPFYDTLKWAIDNTWPMLTLFIVIITVIRITSIIINREKIVFYKEFYGLLAIIYLLLLYYLLLSTEKAASGINLTPFKEMIRYTIGSRAFFYNVIGNIVLFIPFGYFSSSYLKAKKISHIIIPSILISLTAETIQYKIGRAFDVDDIILNVVGAIIGFMAYISIQAMKKHLPKFFQTNFFYNVLALVVFIVIVICCGSIWGVRWIN